VDLSKHGYALEPNVTITPDNKWVVFRSNMHGATHVYEVCDEIPVAEGGNEESPAVTVCQSDGLARVACELSGPGGAMAVASPRDIGRCELSNGNRLR
jgi:hypothetical protein